MQKKSKRLNLILTLCIIFGVGIILWIFLNRQQIPEEPEQTDSHIDENATISIDKVRHTSSKNGVEEWRLEAEAAHFMYEQKKAVFQKPLIIFFSKEQNVRLVANEGILKTDSNDIEACGNVVITNKDYRVEAEKLYYENRQQIFFSKTPIKIMGTAFQLSADSMSFDLKTNQMVFEGNVNGVLYEDISL